MSYAILLGVQELVDFCGSLPAAIEMLEERITRRKSEGKKTALSEEQLDFCKKLWESTGGTYQTPRQEALNKSKKQSGGLQD
jgi:hypothetical protein